MAGGDEFRQAAGRESKAEPGCLSQSETGAEKRLTYSADGRRQPFLSKSYWHGHPEPPGPAGCAAAPGVIFATCSGDADTDWNSTVNLTCSLEVLFIFLLDAFGIDFCRREHKDRRGEWRPIRSLDCLRG